MYKTEQSVKLIKSSPQLSHLDHMSQSDLHFLQRPTQPATDGQRERTSGQVHHGTAEIQSLHDTMHETTHVLFKFNDNAFRIFVIKI